MKVLVTEVKASWDMMWWTNWQNAGLKGIGVDVEEMDITDKDACRRVDYKRTDAVIIVLHTAVDAAEQNMELWQEGQCRQDTTWQVYRDLDISLMYISTDYVFNGTENVHEADDVRSLECLRTGKIWGACDWRTSR